MKKAIAIIIGLVVLAGAVELSILIKNNADNLDTAPEEDSLYYFKKNTTPPEVEVFAENGEQTADITPAAWKVTSPEGNTIYMVGTLHMLNEECYPLPDYIKQAYAQADVIAVETNNVDIGLHLDEDVEYIRSEYCDKDKELKDYLPDDVYKQLSDYLKKSDKDIKDFSDYHPWYVLDMIDEATTGVGTYSANIGLDRVLKLSANIDGKEIYEVESYESKVNLSRSYPDEVYPVLIRQYCNTTDEEQIELIDKTYEAWKNGDEQGIYDTTFVYDPTLTEEEMKIMDEYYQIFVYDRNIIMAEKAKELMSENKKTLFAVGAAHFVGDGGIIDLLEKDGYTCERIDK